MLRAPPFPPYMHLFSYLFPSILFILLGLSLPSLPLSISNSPSLPLLFTSFSHLSSFTFLCDSFYYSLFLALLFVPLFSFLFTPFSLLPLDCPLYHLPTLSLSYTLPRFFPSFLSFSLPLPHLSLHFPLLLLWIQSEFTYHPKALLDFAI